MNTLLQCSNVSKYYGSKQALSHVDLLVPPGRIVGLLGPNGSGKTTFIKLVSGLLTPSFGTITMNGRNIGVETKAMVSYLPERTYLNNWMKVTDIISFFQDFYKDFNPEAAYDMLQRLNINPEDKLKTMSKGTKEKVQLILVMSRNARLFLLDEPIGGVDPAARDYILDTIISNYNRDASIIISTHLINDVEKVLDDVAFLKEGSIVFYQPKETVIEKEGKSIDQLFREVFKC